MRVELAAEQRSTGYGVQNEDVDCHGACARLQNVIVAYIVAGHVLWWPTKQLLVGSDDRGSRANDIEGIAL